MLTRYARSQFINPKTAADFSADTDHKKVDSESENEESSDDDYDSKFNVDENGIKINMDPDHRLLLKNTKPLFQSRNSAVIMAVSLGTTRCSDSEGLFGKGSNETVVTTFALGITLRYGSKAAHWGCFVISGMDHA